jgi:uncharacterized protein (TIGR03435 family)
MSRRFALLLLACACAFAQMPAFEAASIKPSKARKGPLNGRIIKTPGRFAAANAPARLLIQQAYGIKEYQLSGAPAWVGEERFDVEARAVGAPSDEELRVMVRGLLSERFQLVAHWESREMAAYNLVLGKRGIGGLRFVEIKPGQPRPAVGPLRGGLRAACTRRISTRWLICCRRQSSPAGLCSTVQV